MDASRSAYFLLFLMLAAFSLRPRLVLWCGLCIIAARTAMLFWFLGQPGVFTDLDLQDTSVAGLLAARPDPNFLFLGFRTTEIVVIVILTAGLAIVVRRSRRLVKNRAVAERSRANLARYFSPNMVDHLNATQNPLGTIRQQDVAVLFADIMGFTRMCENASAEEVIALLREYHERLGQAVFDQAGATMSGPATSCRSAPMTAGRSGC
ncbi:MAG: adenylate/guanylate cyclase domain-containing protein [Alphaproteobacteria bacterium]|jgi:adenylate cyclase|nr:hypothetical protein [Rhodospirillaceae bacterium]MDG2481631.1 adenylate/guanylate cyclase domain-containing protein [Alphaproteobacteria bacterium]